jgi:hypothetical protein
MVPQSDIIFRQKKTIIQPKLQVNEPGDAYEQEADAMADRVMRMTASDSNSLAKPVTGLIGRSVQRKCSHCEEEEKKKQVMRKSQNGSGGNAVSSSFASTLQTSKGGGTSLPSGTRSVMENAFGTDFSAVRIHTGRQASELNNAIQAKAFTYGNDIYFNDREYASGTNEGRKLLAHELTHVVQQQETIPATIHRQGEEPSKKQVQRDDYLRRLSVWPDEAHSAWRSLNQSEQALVITYMTMRYGVDFTSEFLRYTKLKKKPESVANYTNVLTETHQQLYARGYRFVGTSFGTEHWVHPSGNSIHRILPAKGIGTQPSEPVKPKDDNTYDYGGVTYDKKTGKVVSYPKSMEARCMLPCVTGNTNADDCADCCTDKIPASDDGCMNFCITFCEDYYD